MRTLPSGLLYLLPQPRRFFPSSPQRGAQDHLLPKGSSPCLPCPTLSVPFPCFSFFYLHLSSVPLHEGWGLSPPGSLCTATPGIVPAFKNKPILTALAQPSLQPSSDAPPLEDPSLDFFLPLRRRHQHLHGLRGPCPHPLHPTPRHSPASQSQFPRCNHRAEIFPGFQGTNPQPTLV